MLTAYQQRTRLLLGDEMFKTFRDGDLINYINEGRNQVAAEGECIRGNSTLALVSGTQNYSFSALVLSIGASALTVRSGYIAGPLNPLEIRPWEWFGSYYIWQSSLGIPTIVSQQGQGVSGTLYFFPTPNASLTAVFDTVQLPQTLINDSTPEAIPYPWTDAVPFYAAWLGMITAQHQEDADAMFARYEQIMMRLARQGATPSELPSAVPMDRGLRLQQGK